MFQTIFGLQLTYLKAFGRILSKTHFLLFKKNDKHNTQKIPIQFFLFFFLTHFYYILAAPNGFTRVFRIKSGLYLNPGYELSLL